MTPSNSILPVASVMMTALNGSQRAMSFPFHHFTVGCIERGTVRHVVRGEYDARIDIHETHFRQTAYHHLRRFARFVDDVYRTEFLKFQTASDSCLRCLRWQRCWLPYHRRGTYATSTVYPAHRWTARQSRPQPHPSEPYGWWQGYVRNIWHTRPSWIHRSVRNGFQHSQSESPQSSVQWLR